MRFVLEMALSNEEFQTDYRAVIMSYFKNGLSKYLNGAYFDKYYAPAVIKPFSFAVWLGKAQFSGDKIIIPSKRIKIYWSTDSSETGIVFYNAFIEQKHNSYPLPLGNSMRMEDIAVEREEVISSNDIEVVFVSPLCIRKHNQETNRDQYYSYSKEGFSETLREVLERELSYHGNLYEKMLDDFYIEPINCKKTVVKHHKQFIEATLGTFRMHGDIRLLTHFYLAGTGSRKSAGFGYFNIIMQGR